MAATILLVVLINNSSVAVYGQNIVNSSNHNTSQSQNQTQNDSALIAATNSADKSEKELKNEKIVLEFNRNVLLAKNASAAVNYLEPDYIQHNPDIATGRQGLIDSFLFKHGFQVPQIKRIYADGNYVIVHNLSPMGPAALIDIFRVDDKGKIVEHWDVMQQIPSKSANNNTMFYLH